MAHFGNDVVGFADENGNGHAQNNNVYADNVRPMIIAPVPSRPRSDCLMEALTFERIESTIRLACIIFCGWLILRGIAYFLVGDTEIHGATQGNDTMGLENFAGGNCLLFCLIGAFIFMFA